jgi:hypothetical protein
MESTEQHCYRSTKGFSQGVFALSTWKTTNGEPRPSGLLGKTKSRRMLSLSSVTVAESGPYCMRRALSVMDCPSTRVAGTTNAYRPFSRVTVPTPMPLSETTASASGFPLSDVTVPEITSCACARMGSANSAKAQRILTRDRCRCVTRNSLRQGLPPRQESHTLRHGPDRVSGRPSSRRTYRKRVGFSADTPSAERAM